MAREISERRSEIPIIVVAASDAAVDAKRKADIVCEGCEDQFGIQLALDSLRPLTSP